MQRQLEDCHVGTDRAMVRERGFAGQLWVPQTARVTTMREPTQVMHKKELQWDIKRGKQVSKYPLSPFLQVSSGLRSLFRSDEDRWHPFVEKRLED